MGHSGQNSIRPHNKQRTVLSNKSKNLDQVRRGTEAMVTRTKMEIGKVKDAAIDILEGKTKEASTKVARPFYTVSDGPLSCVVWEG